MRMVQALALDRSFIFFAPSPFQDLLRLTRSSCPGGEPNPYSSDPWFNRCLAFDPASFVLSSEPLRYYASRLSVPIYGPRPSLTVTFDSIEFASDIGRVQ